MLLKNLGQSSKVALLGAVILLLTASLACSFSGSIPFLSTPTPTATNTPTPTPTPTQTPTPTPTLTPTPMTTGHLRGQLVEGVLGQNTAGSPRPPLANVLILLCADFNDTTCTTDPDLATYTDENGVFTFVDLDPGRYVVLYNPYLITDGQDYLQHYTNRELDFTDISSLVTSIIGGAGTLSITGGPNAGVRINIKDGKMTLGQANADTAITTHEYNIVTEFVEDGVPATAQITIGETTELELVIHAVLKVGDSTFQPAGEPIDLPNTHSGAIPGMPVAQSTPKPTNTQLSPTEPPGQAPAGASFFDSFENNRNGWDLLEDYGWGNFEFEIHDGVLAAKGDMTDSMFFIQVAPAGQVSDGEVSAEVQNVSGLRSTEYGIVAYAPDIYSGVQFYITDEGVFNVYYSLPGGSEFLAWDIPSDAIRPGQVNTLRMVMQGNNFTFFINGEQVYQASIPGLPRSGMVGVFVHYDRGSDQVVEWDNFTVIKR